MGQADLASNRKQQRRRQRPRFSSRDDDDSNSNSNLHKQLPPSCSSPASRRRSRRRRLHSHSYSLSHSWLMLAVVWLGRNSYSLLTTNDSSICFVVAASDTTRTKTREQDGIGIDTDTNIAIDAVAHHENESESSSVTDENKEQCNDNKQREHEYEKDNKNKNDNHKKPAHQGSSTKRGGRIKLKPVRKFVQPTTTAAEEWRTSPATPIDGNGDEIRSVVTKSRPGYSPSSFSLLRTKALPFFQRGLFLIGLASLALLEKNNPSPMAAARAIVDVPRFGFPTFIQTATASTFSFLLPFFNTINFRLEWTKIRSLSNEILPSLSSALLLAWVPSLFLQKAWWELGFLALTLASQRDYVATQVLPVMGGTLRKLLWSEFWKRAWDFLLEPFPHNVLMPPTLYPSLSSSSSDGVGREAQQQQHTWELLHQRFSQFWNKRVVSRIDKYTASAMKALLQKNVQASVNGLTEDSWKALVSAVASSKSFELYAFYGKDDDVDIDAVDVDGDLVLRELELPTSSSATGTTEDAAAALNEDVARMVEIETNACDQEPTQQSTTSILQEEQDTVGSDDSDNDNDSDKIDVLLSKDT